MRVFGWDEDAPATRATGRAGAGRLAACGGAVTSTGGRFWTLVSSSCAAPAGIAKTETTPAETEAINKRRLNPRGVSPKRLTLTRSPIPASPSVPAGCFDFRRLVARSVIGRDASASHKRSGHIRTN